MAKIHVNLQQGIIDIEGDETFVRDSFELVRSSMVALQKGAAIVQPTLSSHQAGSGAVDETQTPPAAKKQPTANAKNPGAKYKPKIDPGTDLSQIEAFYNKYGPKNNREKMLVFAAYLRDVLKKSPCSADQLYTCFMGLKHMTKIPEAFDKNIRDAKVEGLLEYEHINVINITTVGENVLVKLSAKAAG